MQGENEYLTKKAGASFFIVTLIAIGLIGWAVASSVQDNAIDDSLGVCNRAVADRVDNARAWTAVEGYYDSIAHAKSVERDVHKLAADVRSVVGESANQLRTRLIQCEPLIKNGKHLIDMRLLREAQGEI